MVVQFWVDLIWTSLLSGPWQSHVLPWGMYGFLESEIQSHLLSVASSRGGRVENLSVQIHEPGILGS